MGPAGVRVGIRPGISGLRLRLSLRFHHRHGPTPAAAGIMRADAALVALNRSCSSECYYPGPASVMLR